MLQSLAGEKSLNFTGTIGKTISAADLAKENYLVDDTRFESEGNWAFCRFNSEKVYGARMGFLRGAYDFSDFGGLFAPTESFLQLHLELMTNEGALLWLPTGQFRAEQMVIDSEKMDDRLLVGEKEIFRIQGWPQTRCHFQSDDGEIEASLDFDLKHTAILPDNILPRNVFSMWVSIGQVKGVIRHRDQNTPVSGFVFLDHPRLAIQRNDVAPQKWFLYTPMFFEDESVLISYYAVDNTGSPKDYYCFGLYVDAKGDAQWLPGTNLANLTFDNYDKPKTWELRWANPELSLAVDVVVKNTSILKVWGDPNLPKTREEFVFLPLVLDGVGTIKKDNAERTTQGYGLAEYWHRSTT